LNAGMPSLQTFFAARKDAKAPRTKANEFVCLDGCVARHVTP